MKAILLNVLFGLMLFCSTNVCCQNDILKDLTFGKGQMFRYVYRGNVNKDLSTYELLDTRATIMVMDNPKFDQYNIVLSMFGRTESFYIKNTRTMLNKGDKLIVYETIDKGGESVTFVGDPEFKIMVHIFFRSFQIILENVPMSEWDY